MSEFKIIPFLILMLCLTGCSYEGKDYFGSDVDNQSSKLAQAYSNKESYVWEAFDNKDVTVKEVETYEDYDTAGPSNYGIVTQVEIVGGEDKLASMNNSGASSSDVKVQFMWPVSGSAKITSGFGGRSSPGGVGSTNHKGIDIACPIGTNVLAAASGTVTVAQWQSATNHRIGYGLWVEIDHGNGVRTRYGHLSKLNVAVGDKVTQGTQIALSGNSGASTGPHCHFEIRKDNIAENPTKYVSAKH